MIPSDKTPPETPPDDEPVKVFIAEKIKQRLIAEPEEGDTPADTQMQQDILDYLTGADEPEDKLITTAEAAAILDCGPAHIAMLCEAGEIDGVKTDESGARLIPLAAIQKLKQQQPEISPEYRKQAQTEMGLYDIPEETFLKPTR